jgi:HEAT repeat protein
MVDERERVQRILMKLELVRARGLSCFGSDSHRFLLNPPAQEVELHAFESAHGIRLPENYRAFLKYAGNGGPGYGGAGPYYGIYPLDKSNDFADWVVADLPADFLARPCPLRPELTPEVWAERISTESPYQGTLSLGTMGCAGMMQLIVTGRFAGRVVYVNAGGYQPYVVHEPDFLSWYERWQDELLGGYNADSFGYGPGGGDADFFRILDDPQASDDFKAEAASAFCRLPGISDATAKRISNHLSHKLAGVRAGACATIRRFQIREASENAARLLDDESPSARRQAIWTVMKLDPERWIQAVIRRLHEDSDNDVATTAFLVLEKTGAINKPELIHIIERSPLGNLRYLAAQKVWWESGDLDLLIRMLRDSHPQVRLYATQGLRTLKAKDCLPAILDVLQGENDDLVIGSILNLLGELGDQSVVPMLLERARSSDDFHRLDAIEALARIGDERALPIAEAMLQEHHRPVSRRRGGPVSPRSVHNMSDVVRKALRGPPNSKLRELGK